MAGTTGLPRRNSLASFGAAELDLSEASIMEWDSTFHPELPSGVTSPSDATTMEQTVSSNRNGSTVADLHLGQTTSTSVQRSPRSSMGFFRPSVKDYEQYFLKIRGCIKKKIEQENTALQLHDKLLENESLKPQANV